MSTEPHSSHRLEVHKQSEAIETRTVVDAWTGRFREGSRALQRRARQDHPPGLRDGRGGGRRVVACCRSHRITAARLTAVGAFSAVTVVWFGWEEREYREIPIEEQVGLLSMIGDDAEHEGEPAVRAHVGLGTSDGSARGGHLRSGMVRPTLELVLDETPAHLRKRHDPESGLALIDIRD